MIRAVLVSVISFIAGLIGCAQILWSAKKYQQRGPALSVATMLSWAAIMVGLGALVMKYLPGHFTTLVISYVAAFLVLLVAQLIQVYGK